MRIKHRPRRLQHTHHQHRPQRHHIAPRDHAAHPHHRLPRRLSTADAIGRLAKRAQNVVVAIYRSAAADAAFGSVPGEVDVGAAKEVALEAGEVVAECDGGGKVDEEEATCDVFPRG